MGRRIIILKGLPASGKSTWAKTQVRNNPGEYVRVNKDDLRAMMFAGAKVSKGRENLVLAVRDEVIVHAWKQGKSVIVDDTNFNPIHEKNIREMADCYGVEVEVNDSFIQVPVDECVRRNQNRKDPVPEPVIWKMYHQYVEPSLQEKTGGNK